jgi:hypothetical protein
MKIHRSNGASSPQSYKPVFQEFTKVLSRVASAGSGPKSVGKPAPRRGRKAIANKAPGNKVPGARGASTKAPGTRGATPS